MKAVTLTVRLALCLVLPLLAAGCGDDNATPTTPTRTSPVTETFASNLTPQGSVWRFITAGQSGTLTATLTSTDQPGTTVGFAIGLRNGTSTGCFVTRDVVVAAGTQPQLSASVDAGSYCVRVFDPAPGQLQRPLNFTVTIVYP